MVQLNNPRYVPIFELEREFVKRVNGNASIAAHAQPMSKNGTNIRYWSVTKNVATKPIAPKSKLIV